MAAILTWLAGTRLGRAVSVALIVLLCWWGFSSYYREQGRQDCQNAINTAFIKTEAKGREVAKQAAGDVAKVEQKAEAARVETVEKIRTVYRDRVTTAPVVTGSCVFPVEPGVQAELQLRWKEANGVTP